MIAPYLAAPQEGPLTFGVEFVPAPGWVVYWKNSGDAGFPPKFDFKGSQGLKEPQVLWPRPKLYRLPGNIREYGYDQDVVYPVRAQAVKTGKILHIAAHLSYLTCKDSCVPHKMTFSLDIPQGAAAQLDPSIEVLLQTFLSQVPQESDDAVLASLQPESSAAASFGWIMVLAFLGGLILNVMPCVLPVLSIKLFGLLGHGGQERRIVIRDSLASALGIVFSFVIGGGLLVIARQAGNAVGWGVQFQDPRFIAFLTVILVLFAFNLWGFFEIHLPPALSHLGAISEDDEGAGSYFISGMFAALLATPCSAPFLGTAMGFAITQQAVVILAIFTAAGTGMAAPYFLLALFPNTIHWLPKPGAWMVRVRHFLGFLLAGTALWLTWVFVHQVGLVRPAVETSGPIQWMPFEEGKIHTLVAAGKPVFVDVTADWCLTCKVNEQFVLQDPQVTAAFTRLGVIMMRADWTRQDASIGRYLASHHRAGIPFYALYTPRHTAIVLSELLTKTQVLRALQTVDTIQ